MMWLATSAQFFLNFTKTPYKFYLKFLQIVRKIGRN